MARSKNNDNQYSLSDLDFHECIVINNASENKLDGIHTRCPLCNELSKSFYCADCVKNGNFTYSKKKCLERSFMFSHLLSRFAEKKPKKYKLEEEKAVILNRYETALANKKEIENVKLSIQFAKEKVKNLKKNIKDVKNEITKGQKRIEDIKNKKSKLNQEREELSLKQRKRRETVKLNHARLSICESDLNTKQCALQSVVNRRVKELVTHIFPITKVPPPCYRDENQFAETELEEAQKTTYIQGQWVIAGNPMDQIQYKIVEPCIPVTGDYSAYPTWCSSFASLTSGADHVEGISRDNLSNSDKHLYDVAYGISGALSYTAQLVNILAFYMDVHLPKRSSINDFCRDEYIERFYPNVAKLNANIINLCLSQNITVSEISAHRTVSNLLLLIESKKNDSRRYLSLKEQEELLESLEDSIFKDLPEIDESDNENSEAEFVHVSDEDILEVPETEEPAPKPAESLYSSVVSFWKAATGQK